MLFDKINAHRASLGLNKLVFDSSAYAMASYHSKYLSVINMAPYSYNIITHDEKIDIPEFSELSFDERCGYFIKKSHQKIYENCAGHNCPSVFKGKENNIPSLILNLWLSSKSGHKENIENKQIKKGACSIVHCKINMLVNGKNIPISYVIAVLDVY
jgi:hypothetical protein